MIQSNLVLDEIEFAPDWDGAPSPEQAVSEIFWGQLETVKAANQIPRRRGTIFPNWGNLLLENGTRGYSHDLGKACVLVHYRVDLSLAQTEELLATADLLTKLYPKKEFGLVVVKAPHLALLEAQQFDPSTLNLAAGDNWRGAALSECGGRYVIISERVFDSTQFPHFTSEHTPASSRATVAQACIIHEFGHLLDTPQKVANKGSGSPLLTKHTSPSKYGRLCVEEAFAEAFAEFTLTSGYTLDPLAQDLANQEGWI